MMHHSKAYATAIKVLGADLSPNALYLQIYQKVSKCLMSGNHMDELKLGDMVTILILAISEAPSSCTALSPLQ